jgi:hydroxypyruvate reductase
LSEAVSLAGPVIERIFAAALAAADPRRAVREAIQKSPERYRVDGRMIVIAIGKAAVTMAQGAIDALGESIALGIAITKDEHSEGVTLPRFEIYEASHPIPDQRGVDATKRAIEIVESAGADDLVLALISGGGSALFEAPEPPVTLADMAAVTNLLLRAGAAIEELNAVRTPLSQVKGGGLLAKVGAARLITLIVSDVLGNDPAVIASGPTVEGNRDPERARNVLERFGLWDRVPESVRIVLGRTVAPLETQRPGVVFVVADNRSAVEAAYGAACATGMSAEIVWTDRVGEAREQAIEWVEACCAAGVSVDCLIGGGELTVTVHGDGMGGRNTEFVLAAALELRRRGNHDWVVASLATDGQDGPTSVAGGFLDGASLDELATDPAESLARNDSLAPLQALGAIANPGPTGTNVNDIYLAIRASALRRRPVNTPKLL